MQRDEAYLLDIYNAANQMLSFTKGTEKSAFAKDNKPQSAVLHQLMILGEAVKRLSKEFKQQHSTISWSSIAGMRNQLIHEYDGVDLGIVWNTVQDDIPDLVQKVEPLLPSPT